MALSDFEVRKLLASARAYDNRKLSESAVLAWSEAARAARWTYAEANRALVRHYANSTEFVQPGHITDLIRAERNDRAMRARALPAARPASRAHIDAVLSELGQRLGWRADRAVSGQRCPACGAAPGRPCTRPGGPGGERVELRGFHPSRREAANESRRVRS